MKYRILVAEDDSDIVTLLKLYLESSGYEVEAVDNGTDALEMIETTRIDLALIDIMMSGMDGFTLIQRVREFSNIPIMVLSARTQNHDRILGLNIGADAYLTKPFNPLEVVANVHSHLRRYYELGTVEKENLQGSQICLGELCMDMNELTLTKNGKSIFLTPTEFKILSKLMRNPGHVYSKSQLYESINGEFFESDDKTMMVHISKIREKIEDNPKEPHYIKTVRGLGYKFEIKEQTFSSK